MSEPDMPERWRDDTQPTGPLTRAGAARHLGVSVATVRRMEGRTLQPAIDARGRHLFERAEVYALAQARARTTRGQTPEGKVAAKVFTMFEEAAELPEIVIALEIEPLLVRALYREWRVNLEAHYLRTIREAKIRREARTEAQAQREIDDWERRFRRDEDSFARDADAPGPRRRLPGANGPSSSL